MIGKKVLVYFCSPGPVDPDSNSAVMVVVGSVDFFRNSIDRITRRLAELVKLISPVYDDDPGDLVTSVG